MKPALLLYLFFVLLSGTSQAQKNNWYAGGQLGISLTNSRLESNGTSHNKWKSTSWSLSPEVGTFITNDWQVGVGILLTGISSRRQESPFDKDKQKQTGGLLYTRHFWGKEAFRPFAGISTRYQAGKSTFTSGSSVATSKTTSFNATANAGFSYALSKRVTALGSLGILGYGYSTSKSATNSEVSKSSSFGLDIDSMGDRFNIGFYFTL